MEQELLAIENEISKLQILIRVNNLLLSRFILQLSKTREDLHLPKRNVFFKFELLQDDYDDLVKKFGRDMTDKALYKLDRMLLANKQDCPNNVKKYIAGKLKKKSKVKQDDI